MSYTPKSVYVDTAGDAMTGDLTINKTVGDPNLYINGPAGSTRRVQYQTATSARWQVVAGSTAESGGLAGSNLEFQRFNDSGAYVDTPMSINRQNGLVSLPNGVSPLLPGSGYRGYAGSPVAPTANAGAICPLNTKDRQWGDPAAIDASGLGSGYFRVAKGGAWQFDTTLLVSWAGDGFLQSGSVVVGCGATNYIQGYYFLIGTGLQPNRIISGVHVSGTNIQSQEDRGMTATPTVTGIQMWVAATYLGPSI